VRQPEGLAALIPKLLEEVEQSYLPPDQTAVFRENALLHAQRRPLIAAVVRRRKMNRHDTLRQLGESCSHHPCALSPASDRLVVLCVQVPIARG
jgi:hypothetical protein